MNTLSLRYWRLVLLSGSLLVGCDHRLDPSPLGQFRLKTVSYNARPDNAGFLLLPQTYELTYDPKGLLAAYAFTETLGGVTRRTEYVLSRDAQDRLVQVAIPGLPLLNGFINYTYADPNRLGRVMTYFRTIDPLNRPRPLDVLIRQDEFGYDTADGLLPARRTELQPPLTLSSTETYAFVNGNAVTINGTPYAYDDKPNPYYGLLGFNASQGLGGNPQIRRPIKIPFDNSDYFADVQVKLFNKNNILNNVSRIDYNADGLVTRIEYTNGNEEAFTYERKP